MTRDQKTVAIGAASGAVSMIIAVAAIYHLWPTPGGLMSAGDRSAYALKGLAFAAVPLFAMIITVGNSRFLSEAIDPTLHKENKAQETNGRVTENTLQQFVLLAAGLLALVATLDASQMR